MSTSLQALRHFRPLLARSRGAATAVATSDPFKYVPGGPIYKGTSNDATTFPPPSRTHGSHHWAYERLLSAALVPLTVSAYVTSASPYPVLDGIFAAALVMHSHIGFDQVLVDYVHERKFPLLGVVAKWGLRVTTLGVLAGCYQFNTEDVGLTEGIKRIWKA